MVTVQVSVHISRPVNEVFAYMGDPTNVPEWNPMIEDATPSETPLRVGTRVHLQLKFLGRKIELPLEIVEHEPNSRIAHTFDKPFKGKVTERYEDEGGGTRVVQVFEVDPGGFFRVAEPVAARIFQKQSQACLDTVREILEARAPAEDFRSFNQVRPG